MPPQAFAPSGLLPMSLRLCRVTGVSPTSIWKDQEGQPGAQVQVDGLSLTVAEFVSGALTRQLRWYENHRYGVITLVLRQDQCWHRTCRKRMLVTYRVETLSGTPWRAIDWSFQTRSIV